MYLLFVILIFLLAYRSQTSSLSEAKIHYKVIFALIFFMWGFEYNCSNDYVGYVADFFEITSTSGATYHVSEPLYLALVRLCQPIGFFGFGILLAFIGVAAQYLFVKKNIDQQYLALFFFVYMLNPSYCLMLMNTWRQVLGFSVTLFGLMLYMDGFDFDESYFKKIYNRRTLYFISSIIIAGLIHKACYFGILIIPFFMILPKKLNQWQVLLIILLFFISFKFQIDVLAIEMYMSNSEDLERYSHYLEELGETNSITLIYRIFDVIVLTLFLNSYNHYNQNEKIVSAMAFTGMITMHFMSNTIGRVMMPFTMMMPYAYTIIYKYLQNKTVKYVFLLTLSVYVLRLSYLSLFVEGTYYHKWMDFQTILSQPWM